MLFWLSEYFVIFKGSMTAWCKESVEHVYPTCPDGETEAESD